jgi:1,4-dihydroxy-2-naphthoyl-CoA hydrolase
VEIIKDKQAWIDGQANVIKNSAIEHLDIRITDVDDDSIEMTMPVNEKTRQPFGLLHGGMNMVLAESAASFHATWGVDLSERVPVGIEISGSHLRSASDGLVRAKARVLRRSRNFIVHQVDIFHEETGKQLSAARVTNYYKRVGAE